MTDSQVHPLRVPVTPASQQSPPRADAKSGGGKAALRARFEQERDGLKDIQKAARTLGELLLIGDPEELWLEEAEELLSSKGLVLELGKPLASAYRALGHAARELSVLGRELDVAGPERLPAVQRRLAELRLDFLDDPEGAMELLEPLLSKQAGDDESRQRYLKIAVEAGRHDSAASVLGRALSAETDNAVIGRVRLDLAKLFLHQQKPEKARAELVEVLSKAAETPSALAAAELMLGSFAALDLEARVLALAVTARADVPAEVRGAAVESLRACLADAADQLSVQARRKGLAALLSTKHYATVIDELEALCEEAADSSGLAQVYAVRAQHAADARQAAALAFRAAELVEKSNRDPALSTDAWRKFVARFPQHPEGVERLCQLLEGQEDYTELSRVLTQAALGAEPQAAARHLARLGRLFQNKLGDQQAALDALTRSLELADNDLAQAVLEDMMRRGQKRLEAALALERAARTYQNDELLLDVLGVKLDLVSATEGGDTIAGEMFEHLATRLNDPVRALAVVKRGLAAALAGDGSVVTWLDRLSGLGEFEDSASMKSRVLAGAAGDRPVEDEASLRLAKAAAEALLGVGDWSGALVHLERALAYAPSDVALALGMDRVRAEQGVAPKERVAALEQCLAALEQEPEPWSQVVLALAALERDELGESEAAAARIGGVLERLPQHRAAHRALVQLYEDSGDLGLLAKELERAVGGLTGADRLNAEFRLAMLQADNGDPAAALALCDRLLEAPELDREQLEAIFDLAEQSQDLKLACRAQLRRAESEKEPLLRAQELERLGQLWEERVGDASAAADAYRSALELVRELSGEEEYCQKLFERVLDVAPDDLKTAQAWVRFSINGGNWERSKLGFGALMSRQPTEAARLLLELAPRAQEEGVAADFASLVDEIEWGVDDAGDLRRELALAKSHVLASDPGSRLEAIEAFRALITVSEKPEDEAAFEAFLRDGPLDDLRIESQRWLCERRAANSDDRCEALLSWAKLEEGEFREPEAAIAIYERVLEQFPDSTLALERLAELRGNAGAYDGAVDALEALRQKAEGPERNGLALRIAELQRDELERYDAAFELVAEVLKDDPTHAQAREFALSGLQSEEQRVAAALALQAGLERSAPDAEILEALITAFEGSDELPEEQRRWYELLMQSATGESAFDLCCRAASQMPDSILLWARAEELAAELESPQPVLAAYERALARELPDDIAQQLGRRLIAFQEQWFADSTPILTALLSLLAQSPGARWALQPAVLALTSQSRFEEAFGLFDAAITFVDETERGELLDEAALYAKDLAADPERAIVYLEQLSELRPEDARVQSTLERLYKRTGHTRELIALLSSRLENLSGAELCAMHEQIATRWLELDESDEALSSVQEMLALDPDSDRACTLLERMLGTSASDDADAWDDWGDPALQENREAVAELLKATYQRRGRVRDAVRIAEVELDFLEDPAQRGQVLREIVAAKLEDLDDKPGAFASLCRLVVLDPSGAGEREQLRSLAQELAEHKRYAELLATAGQDSSLEGELVLEAARVYEEMLDDPGRELQLFERALQLATDDQTVLIAARALDRLLMDTEDIEHRCEVLERLSAVEPEQGARRQALLRAAQLAGDALGDWARAAQCYRDALHLSPDDLEALDGLVSALERGQEWTSLIAALGQRAALQDAPRARRDHVRMAELYGRQLADPEAAIEQWRGIHQQFGEDAHSLQSLKSLLAQEQRWEEYAELLRDHVRRGVGGTSQQLLMELGATLRDRLEDPRGALEAFAEARVWGDAVALVEAASGDEASELTDQLQQLAVERWERGDAAAADAAYWAIKTRAQQLLDRGAPDKESASKAGAKGKRPSRKRKSSLADQALARLEEGAALPFDAERVRSLRRAAALVKADALGDAPGALAMFQALFDEDAGDAVALKSTERFAQLLEEAERYHDQARLLERMATLAESDGDTQRSRDLFENAGDVWLRLPEEERALAAYGRAATHGSARALEAVVTLREARDEPYAALDACELLVRRATSDAAPARLAEAFDWALSLGCRVRAIELLKGSAGQGVVESYERLVRLYQEDGLLRPLAELYAIPPAALPAEQQAMYRLQGARLLLEKLQSPERALELLQPVLDDPSDGAPVSLLAEAWCSAQKIDGAHAFFEERLASYGARRPKGRAMAHYALAKVELHEGRRAQALEQLQLAMDVSATEPEIVFEFARLSLEEGEAEAAEAALRRLLLLLHRATPTPEDRVTRPLVYLALSEAASRRGDAAGAKDCIESAFETSLEGHVAALQLEHALRLRGRTDLLRRALEGRYARAEEASERADVLRQLCGTYDQAAEGSSATKELEARARQLQESLIGDSEAAEAHRALAQVFAWLGDSARELAELDVALDELPAADLRLADAEAAYRVLDHVLGQGDAARAAAVCRRAVGLDPTPARLLPMFEKAIAAFPDSIELLRLNAETMRRYVHAQHATALALVAEHPESTAEEARQALLLAASNRSLLERLAPKVTERPDLTPETRVELCSVVAREHRVSDPAKAVDWLLAAVEDAGRTRRLALLADAARLSDGLGVAALRAKVYRRWFDEEPGNAHVWEPLFASYLELGETEELKPLILEQLPRVTSSHDRARLCLAEARLLLQEESQREAAVTLLERALDEDPEQLEVADLLADTLEQLGRLDELVEVMTAQRRAAREQHSEKAEESLTMRLGALLKRQGRLVEARSLYEEFLSDHPRHVGTLRALVDLAQELDVSGLAHHLAQLFELESGAAVEAVALALYEELRGQGDAAAARGVLEKGFARYPRGAVLRGTLMDALRADGDAAGAAGVAERAFLDAPRDTQRFEEARRLWLEAGDRGRALSVVERRLEVRPEEANTHYGRSELLTSLGRNAEALAALEAAYGAAGDAAGVYLQPLISALVVGLASAAEKDKEPILFRLVDLLEQAGDVAAAREHLLGFVESRPTHRQALGRLAKLAEASGDRVAFVEAERRLLRLVPRETLAEAVFRLLDACDNATLLASVIDDLEWVRRQLPEHERLQQRLRVAYESVGETRRLADLLMDLAVRSKRPQQKAAALAQAASLVMQDSPERAEAWLEEAQATYAEPAAAVQLARLKALRGNRPQALKELEALARPEEKRRSSARVLAYRELARLHLEADELREAFAALSEAHKLDRGNGEIALLLGTLAFDLDEERTASRALRAVVSLRQRTLGSTGADSQSRAKAYTLLARLALQAGDAPGAERLAKKALAEDAGHTPAATLLGHLSGNNEGS